MSDSLSFTILNNMQKLLSYDMFITLMTIKIIFGLMSSITQSNFISSFSDTKTSHTIGLSISNERRYNSTIRNVIGTLQQSRKLMSNNDFNEIDACWRGDANWADNRMKLANCVMGFGSRTTGGKGGEIYVVNDSNDDSENPTQGTLRYGVIQSKPLWITFEKDMRIVLKNELLISSDKTIDGRGANVQIGFGPCLTLHEVSNIIIHGISIHNCTISDPGLIRSSPSKLVSQGSSDGDAISIFHSNTIWIDHVSLSSAQDGLIDITHGSTKVTISNNYFSDHDKVILLGHDDSYIDDKNMNVTMIYNHFGPNLVQRMPRCRNGLVHVINNDYPNGWTNYAIGGSANPTILSVGNRFVASNKKEVTLRASSTNSESWIWKSINDAFLNGAYFTESGANIDIEKYGVTTTSKFTPSMTTDSGVLNCLVGSTC